MRNGKGQLYIIDFGLSMLRLAENNPSTNNNKKQGFVGTPRYASLAAHNGFIQQPKDDIESLLYIVGALYSKKGPWFNIKCPRN
jgi:serine/threonine protein kinase